MYEILILCLLGVIMTEIYSRTKRPKLYAFLNVIIGSGSFIVLQSLTDTLSVTNFNSALSAILGVPGTVLIYIVNALGVI